MSRWIAPKVGDLVRYRGTGAVYLVSSVTKNGIYVGLVGFDNQTFNMNTGALEVVCESR